MRIVVGNMQGVKDEDCMTDLLDELKRRRARVAILTETHFDVRDSEEFKKMANEYGYRSYSVTRWMRRFDHGSGGVTVLVCEDLRSKEVKKSKHEDMLWVCVEGGDEKLFVGGIYIVPTSSSRARKAEELIQELAEDIARYQQEGTVMVGGDWNCKIGEIQSEAGDRTYERQSVSKKVDTRGKKMMEIMNANNMVVLNGIGGKRAEHTYFDRKGDSDGIDDYIAVSGGMVHKTSHIDYWLDMRDLVDSDHCGLQCELYNRWQEQKGEHSKEKKKIVSFSQVGKMKDYNM